MTTTEPISTLQDENERNRLPDSATDAFFGLDLTGQCISCIQTCNRLLGYADPGEVVGKNMHALIHYRRADGTPYLQEESPIYRALQSGERAHEEGDVFWRADGSGFRVEYWSHPTRRDGRIVGALVT